MENATSLRQHVQEILDDLESASSEHDPRLVLNSAFSLMVLKWRELGRGRAELEDWLTEHLGQMDEIYAWD